MSRRSGWMILATGLLWLGPGCGSGGAPELVVSAAASLRVPLEEIGRGYEAHAGVRMVLNSASSSSLARQIREGAPVDLFLSADARQMDAAEASGRVVAGTRVDLLGNRLAVVTPVGRGSSVGELADLAAGSIRRIGMGEPDAVPAGVYARQWLESAGLWERLRSKVVPGRSVETTLSAAEEGLVDAAFVYVTDAQRSARVETAFVAARGERPRIVYPAAVVAGGCEAESRSLLEYLQGPEASAVFERYGFEVF